MARRVKKTWKFRASESRREQDRHLRITEDMLESEAWKQLDVYERDLYINLKRKFWINTQNGQSNERNIAFTYSEGRALMTPKRFTKSIDKLIEVGLIDLVEHWPHCRRATIYGLSARWHNFGTDHFQKQTRIKAKAG